MNWAGPKTKRATVQGPLGKLELQGGSQMLHCSRRLTVSLGVLFLAFAMCTAVAFGQAAPPATYSHDAYLDNQVTVNNCSAGEPVALNVAGTECVLVRRDIYLRMDPDYETGPWTVEEMNLLADEAEAMISRTESHEY